MDVEPDASGDSRYPGDRDPVDGLSSCKMEDNPDAITLSRIIDDSSDTVLQSGKMEDNPETTLLP